MGRRRDVVLAAAALLLAVVLAVVIAPESGDPSYDTRFSTFRNSPHGARALALTLEALEIPVTRRLGPLTADDSITGPLAILAPTRRQTPAELRRLTEWLDEGGTLIYVARTGDSTLRALGLELVDVAGPSDPDEAPDDDDVSTYAKPRPHRWTEGTGIVHGFRRAFADSSAVIQSGAHETLLATDAGEIVALTFRHGEGTVIAWSDAAPLTNEWLRESGAALAFVRAVAEATDDGTRPLVVDEYHHGFRSGGSPITGTLRFLRERPLGHVVLQLGLVAIGLLYLLGRRFGAPYPPAPAHRRSPLEHVEALAGAYRQAGARRTARRLLLAGLARRIGRRLPRDSDDERRLLDDLATHALIGTDRVRELEAEWRRGAETDLVALSEKVDRILTEVKRT